MSHSENLKRLMRKSKLGEYLSRDDFNFLEAAFIGSPEKYRKLKAKVDAEIIAEIRGQK